MGISSGDPLLLLLHGIDESSPTADAVNTGSLGAAHDLDQWHQVGGNEWMPDNDAFRAVATGSHSTRQELG